MPSSVRGRRVAQRAAQPQSLGLEDEQSFGSDEDLMETVGEIPLDESTQDFVEPPSSAILKVKRKPKTGASAIKTQPYLLADSRLMPPLPPVQPTSMDAALPVEGDRDPPRRGSSIMGGFKLKKGLRRFRDDSSSSPRSTKSDSISGLQRLQSNASSSRPSLASSSRSNGPPHLAPLSLSSSTPSHRSLSIAESEEFNEKRLPLNGSPVVSVPPISVTSVSGPLHKPFQTTAGWAPGEISSAILPIFPSTINALEPIIVLTSSAAKRPPSSILTSAPESGSRHTWTPCTIVFTLFKVAHSSEKGDEERTVAHVHEFAGSPPVSPNRRVKNPPREAPRVESERRTLLHTSTASVCSQADGARLLRICFGGSSRRNSDWVVELRDSSQVHEWIRQIRKTAIMISAETLGYGAAIRHAYDDKGVSADDLAQRLSLHARSVDMREAEAKKQAEAAAEAKRQVQALEAHQHTHPVEAATRNRPQKQETGHADSLRLSHQDPRRNSLDALQTLAINRSNSAGADSRPRNPTATLPGTEERPMRNSRILAVQGGDSDRDSIAGLTLSFSSSLDFPTPPSALPVPKARRPSNSTAQPTLPPSASGASSPVTDFTPNMLTPTSTADNSLASTHDEEESVTPVLETPTFQADQFQLEERLDDIPHGVQAPPTPPLSTHGSTGGTPRTRPVVMFKDVSAPSSVHSATSSTAGTARLRRLRARSQAIDIMSELNQIEADSMPPPPEEAPIRTDRETRIRFAE